MNGPLPVTLIGGFPGSGKTSILHHFLSEHATAPIAVFVESASGSKLDVRALAGLCGAANRLHDVIEEIPVMENARQVEWLAHAFERLSQEGGIQRVFVEVSGTSTSARLGCCFGSSPGHSYRFSPWAKLDNVVGVVDALDYYQEVVLPARSGKPAPFVDFRLAQIKGASLLILNKCDLVDDSMRLSCRESLRLSNPNVSIIETAYGELSHEIWSRLGTPQKIGLALEKSLPIESTSGPSNPMTEEPDLRSALYLIHRPFHPGRFWDWFDADHPGLLRAKGLIWLATRNLLVGGISRTRWQSSCGGAGIWWAALPREEWPAKLDSLQRMQATWREPYGDRRQELTLLGDAKVLPEILHQLAQCLLTDEEFARPVADWLSLSDPFPDWDIGATS